MATKNSRGAEQAQNSSQDSSMANYVPFDWESLPELAKNRWEEAVAFDLTVETHLAKAQASRGQAEVERQRVAGEILEATREVCHEIAADARKALQSVRKKEVEAARKHTEAETALKQAESVKTDAEAQAETVIARATQEADEILDRARAAAEKEAEEVNQRASLQARKVLVQVEMMKAAAQEEMETQRIYSQVARLKAESLESLSEVKLWVEELPAITAEGTGDVQQTPQQNLGSEAENPAPDQSSLKANGVWEPQYQAEVPQPEQAGPYLDGSVPGADDANSTEPRSKKKPGM